MEGGAERVARRGWGCGAVDVGADVGAGVGAGVDWVTFSECGPLGGVMGSWTAVSGLPASPGPVLPPWRYLSKSAHIA